MSDLRLLFKLAAPVVLAHLAGMAMQLVDTAYVGRLGAEAIGGTAIGNAVFATFMIVGIGVLQGLDYLAGHAYGAGKIEECHTSLVQALYFSTALSFPLMLVMYFGANLFTVFGVDAGVARQASLYLKSLSWSLWPFLLFISLRQYLQAMGEASVVLLILLVANILNAFGNWVFVLGGLGFTSLGVVGSGLATLLSRLFMLATLLVYVLWRDDRLNLGLKQTSLRFSKTKTKELLLLGLPSGIQMLLEVGVFSTASLLVGRLGAVSLAAHQIVLMIASMTFMIPLGLSSATSVRVGQILGSGHRARAVKLGWKGIALGGLFMGFSGLGLYLFSNPILRIFITDPEVLRVGRKLLLVAAFFQLADGIQVTATGALRGLGNTRASMLANLIGHWAIGLPIGAFLCFKVLWGVLGLWLGLSLGLICVSIALLWSWQNLSKR